MNVALLLIALTIGQANPNRAEPPATAEKEEPAPFTLDELAAGAKNDAFVDEFLKEKKLTLFGTVQGVERFAGDEQVPPRYRLLMTRLGRNEGAVDVEVQCYFAVALRKDLALLEPAVAKVVVQGSCTKATLQTLAKGMGFMLVLEDCKIIPTPVTLQTPTRSPGSAIIPNVIEPGVALPRTTPAPPPPPLPMQP